MPEPMLVNGNWIEGAGPPLASINPADGSLNAEFSTATVDDVDAAVSAAQAAFDAGKWRNLRPGQRADHLFAFGRAIIEHKEELARLQMRENGKTITECRAQATTAAAIVRYFASLCEVAGSEVTPPTGDYVSMTVEEPYGVVALITPWNSPITLTVQKLAPALAAGNSIVLKPSEVTPGIGLLLGRLCEKAGVPAGVVNVVTGVGREVGEHLVRHPLVRMISFTGGTASGRAVARIAGERLVPAALELGGKSPNIVFADTDVEKAAAGVAAGIFGSQGQSCIAGSRLFVQEPVRDALVARLSDIAAAWRIGQPVDESAQMGPMASFAHRERIAGYVELARSEGGSVLAGGTPPEGDAFAKGAYYRPTIIGGLDNTARVCQEEIFGPVLCVIPFTDENDVIAQANDTVYGLACGVWTGDFSRAWRVARGVQAGTVWVNTYRQFSVSTPFGGMKDSGIGRERGSEGIRLYTQTKSVFLAT
jgi:betaine-aldehyde dehydrogenase